MIFINIDNSILFQKYNSQNKDSLLRIRIFKRTTKLTDLINDFGFRNNFEISVNLLDIFLISPKVLFRSNFFEM